MERRLDEKPVIFVFFKNQRQDLPIVLCPKGGGGTDFRQVFQWVEQQGISPECLIYLTDLECSRFPEEPFYPVLWARIGSTILKPPDAWEKHAYPGKKERGVSWNLKTFYEICTPSYKTGSFEEMIPLPMRENCEYPEVEESFLLLRKEYEKSLKAAYHNAAFGIRGKLGITAETKREVAPATPVNGSISHFAASIS